MQYAVGCIFISHEEKVWAVSTRKWRSERKAQAYADRRNALCNRLACLRHMAGFQVVPLSHIGRRK